MKRDLFAEIRDAGVAVVARQLGLTVLDFPEPGSITPCPKCGAEKRGTGDRRGPIGIHRTGIGWVCHRCQVSGDALSLAAVAITGDAKPNSEGWRDIRRKFLGAELPTFIPKPHEYQRPPIEEILELWHKSTSVYDSAALVPILEDRCFDPGELADRDLCRVLHQGHLPRWATSAMTPWNQSGHICLFPLFDHHGAMVSVHARRMEEGAARPKGLSPVGYEIGGLLFLDSLGRALFGGEPLSRMVIVEGAPDFLTASLSFGDENLNTAVAGVISGSWIPATARQISTQTKVTIATHEDRAGERFSRNIAETLTPDHHIKRWRFKE
jgi:hypothetical protein